MQYVRSCYFLHILMFVKAVWVIYVTFATKIKDILLQFTQFQLTNCSTGIVVHDNMYLKHHLLTISKLQTDTF